MAIYSRLCDNRRIRVKALPDVWVEGFPWGLFRGNDNFYCDSDETGLEIIKLNAKNYDDARKETIQYANSILNYLN